MDTPVPDDPEAPEADALENRTEVVPEPRRPNDVSVPFEANEADVLEQATEEPTPDDV